VGQRGPAWAELVGELPPSLPGGFLVRLPEGLAQGGRHHRMLAFGHVGESVAHPVHDPNAIDALRFSMALPFAWPAIARPRQQRLPARSAAA
jgi:hypothetical protein